MKNAISFLHLGAGLGVEMGPLSTFDYHARWFQGASNAPPAQILTGCFLHAELVTWQDMPMWWSGGSDPVALDARNYQDLFNALFNLSGYDVTSKYGTWSSSVQYNSTAYERLWCLKQWSLEMKDADHYTRDGVQPLFSIRPHHPITKEYYDKRRSPWVVKKTESDITGTYVQYELTNIQPLLALAIFTEQNIANSGTYDSSWFIYDKTNATGTIHYE